MDSTLQRDLGFLLSRASGLVARRVNAALAEHGLRIRQYSVLSLAAGSAEGSSQRDLARVLGLDPSQVVLLVDELERAGLVERRPSLADRRTRLVVTTAQGRLLLERATECTRVGVDEQLRVLDPDEREVLRALLTRVVAAADGGVGP